MKSLSMVRKFKGCNRLFVIAILLFTTHFASGQNSTVSPYSRYGIGDLTTNGYARNMAMGGISAGLNQSFFINSANPASYSNLWFTVFEGAVNFEEVQLNTATTKQYSNSASLSYFDLAFPIKAQKWSMGFGLSPYSKVGYTIEQTVATPYNDAEIHTYKGSGGLNTFHMGTGFKLAKKLSAGFNVEYIFGVINQDRTVEYRSPYYMATLVNNSNSIGWFHYTFGLQYSLDSLKLSPADSIVELDRQIMLLNDSLGRMIKRDTSSQNPQYQSLNDIKREIATAKAQRKAVVNRKKRGDWQLTFGLTASPDASLRSRTTSVATSFRYYNAQIANQVLLRDTVIYSPSVKGKVLLPFSGSLGFSIRNGSRWLIGADYSIQQWSRFSINDQLDSLSDSWRASVGAQFNPSKKGDGIAYRLGGHYEQTYFNFAGTKINETGISFGLGIPIKRTGTHLHLSFEVGGRGTTEHNLIQEKYYRFSLGLTINDRWFIKPKYD